MVIIKRIDPYQPSATYAVVEGRHRVGGTTNSTSFTTEDPPKIEQGHRSNRLLATRPGPTLQTYLDLASHLRTVVAAHGTLYKGTPDTGGLVSGFSIELMRRGESGRISRIRIEGRERLSPNGIEYHLTIRDDAQGSPLGHVVISGASTSAYAATIHNFFLERAREWTSDSHTQTSRESFFVQFPPKKSA